MVFDFFDPGFGYPYGQTHKLKGDSVMTKEEALKKIDELKEYVKKCEEKEKIPKMPQGPMPENQSAVVCQNTVTNWLTFEEKDTHISWAILAYELAQLLYAREYLKVDGEKLLRARKHGDMVFKVIFDVTECRYEVIDVFNSQMINENDRIWCFTNVDDANRVKDYMNKYVAHVKKNMF